MRELVAEAERLAERLTLNYQTGKNGQVRVGLSGPNNTLIPGHGLADCKPLTGDRLNQNVAWETGADISALRRKYPVVRLTIEAKNADVYALQFQPWLR